MFIFPVLKIKKKKKEKKNVTNLLSILIPDPDKKRSSSEKLCSLELPELDSISNYPNHKKTCTQL